MESSITGHRAGVLPLVTVVFAALVTCTQITAAEASKFVLEREGGAGLGQAVVRSTRSPSRLGFPQKEAAEKRSTDTCSLEQSSICSFQRRCIDSSVPGAAEECGSTRSAPDAKLRQPLSKASQHRQVSGLSEHLPADIKANKRQSRAQPNIYTGCCHATECSLARQGFL